jgi:hypothetical protein
MTNLPSLIVAGIVVLICGLATAAVATTIRFWLRPQWRQKATAEDRLDRLAMLGFLVGLAGFLLALAGAIDWTLFAANWREMSASSRASRVGGGVYVAGLMLWIAVAVCSRPGSTIHRSLRRFAGVPIVAGLLLAFPFLLATYGQERAVSADDLGAHWWSFQLLAWGAITCGLLVGAIGVGARAASTRMRVPSRLHDARMLTVAAALIATGSLITITSMGVWKWNRGNSLRHYSVTDTRMAESILVAAQFGKA